MSGSAWTRRAFLASSGAMAGVLALGSGACSSDDGGDRAGVRGSGGEGGDDGPVDVERPETSDDGIPTEAAIFGWISRIFEQGIRRPGYPAGEWTEELIAEQMRVLGLEDVHFEPVQVNRWEPREWSLEVTPDGRETRTVDCWPCPYLAPADGLELDLLAWDEANPAAVAGQAALYDNELLRIPADFALTAGSAPADTTGRFYDPDDTLGDLHVLPFGSGLSRPQEPVIEAGAAAFIGVLKNYPYDSTAYYGPYDGVDRDIPGVWVNHTDGEWLHEQLAAGPVRIRLTTDVVSEVAEDRNVIGELPGADDQIVMVGSHHDGPWASAVEDASGAALVLAQAAYWAGRPRQERPHRLRFVLQAGHMAGGAGLRRYVLDHREELDEWVLHVHLEHAALEVEAGEGRSVDDLVVTDRPVPRWFFTTRQADLEAAVMSAIEDNDLRRSMVIAPDAFGNQPASDGAFYHNEGVPLVQFLAAPWYLADEADTLDKVDRQSLVPLTRATIQIIESTRDKTASTFRQNVAVPWPEPPSHLDELGELPS